jgi:hypothetical protein
MTTILLYVNRFALPLLGLAVAAGCALWLLRPRRQSPPGAWLLNTVNHDKLPLARFENSVGRSKRCDVVLNYPSVSRFHAVIARRRDGWVIVDTGSSVGTKLDGLPVERQTALTHGQAVTFGTFEFLFCDAQEEAKGATY